MTSVQPLWRQSVTYGAIGGTRADDLLAFPPRGYRPMRTRRRIGHGDNRFEWAGAQVLSWGIQRMSGFRVEVEDAPAEVTDNTYLPVHFDDSGAPVDRAVITGPAERTFGPDGTPFLLPGDTAVLGIRFLGAAIEAPVRVVYVVDEPTRRGFGYGTLAGHPESGEESFIVEKTDDGSVWLTVSAFSRPSSFRWRMLALPLRMAQARFTNGYLSVLAGSTD